MRRKPVQSSSLRSVGYEPETDVLEVEFNNARVYHYFAVPARVHQELLSAPSPGAYFNQHIKPRYPSRQVDD